MTPAIASASFDLANADREALSRLLSVEPVWTGVALARDVLDIERPTILHAGPPAAVEALCTPLENSVMMAMLFEGWAADIAEARELLRAGAVRLRSAQDLRVMLPLAAVLSPSMVVQIVTDRTDPRRVAYSPINGGIGPAPRLGLAGPNVLAHLRWLHGEFAATLTIVHDREISLLPIADAALAQGDDCHGRTVCATRLLTELIGSRLGASTIERRFIDQSPSFFLNLWMAATKCVALAGEGPGSSMVTALGSNGTTIGLQVGGMAARWFCASCEPPRGNLEAGVASGDRLGAIGDSALIDALGLGAMAMAFAPEQSKALGDFMPEPGSELAHRLLSTSHPGFPRTGALIGLAARRVVETGRTPAIALGILDRNGRRGRIGGGIYAPPLALFTKACSALNA